MDALEATEIGLILVFLESLLEKMPAPETLDYQNLAWTIRVINDRFLRKRKVK